MAILGRCCYFFVLFVFICSQASGFMMEKNPEEKVDKEPDCFICQLLVVSVEVSIIGNNATMDGIVQAASSMCDGLGTVDSGIVQQCHELIEEYLEQIIDMIVVQFFQPYDVCAYLNLCP